MYITITKVKCAGCGESRYFAPPGLRIKYNAKHNYKLLLACSPNCAQKFIEPNKIEIDEPVVPDVLLTKYGPIPYRQITKTRNNNG